jgi:hypothetical protein
VRKKPKEWIPDAVWLNIVALSNMDAFRDIPDSVFRNDGLWRQWYDQEAPEMAKVSNDQVPYLCRGCVCLLAGWTCDVHLLHLILRAGASMQQAPKHLCADNTCMA